MNRLLTVILKELEDVRHSRLILTTLVIPTILYIVLSVVALRVGSMPGVAGLTGSELQALERSVPRPNDLSATAFQALIVDQVLVLFMLAPLFIPLTIASYSIIGEKQLRTLEPLLATPIHTWELLGAKALAALIPGVAVSWISYVGFMLVSAVTVSTDVVRVALAPVWLVSFGLLAPLFALLAVGMAVIASSRTSDPRAAQQLGAVVILPISGLLTAQVFGVVRLDVSHALMLTAGAALADVLLLLAAVRLFDRETILTRWR
ncbi:MAG: ABC transporter permease [Chloroflexi bacterium]|nr:ABC transporter permease [Chloroflexota bacterium]